MAKNSKGKVIFPIGGNKAVNINPHGLIRLYKSVCLTDHMTISPEWRETKSEATNDAIDHINRGHNIDYDIKIGLPS